MFFGSCVCRLSRLRSLNYKARLFCRMIHENTRPRPSLNLSQRKNIAWLFACPGRPGQTENSRLKGVQNLTLENARWQSWHKLTTLIGVISAASPAL